MSNDGKFKLIAENWTTPAPANAGAPAPTSVVPSTSPASAQLADAVGESSSTTPAPSTTPPAAPQSTSLRLIDGEQAIGSKGKLLSVNKIGPNFVVEFDVKLPNEEGDRFIGMQFRSPDDRFSNAEYFYFRAGQNDREDALQYVPVINGMVNWQLYYHGAVAGTTYKFDPEWNRFKIVVLDDKMSVYVNDMNNPKLTTELLRKDLINVSSKIQLNISTLFACTKQVTFANFSTSQPTADMIKEVPTMSKPLPMEAGTVQRWMFSTQPMPKQTANEMSRDKPARAITAFRSVNVDRSGRAILNEKFPVNDTNNSVIAFFDVFNVSESEVTRKMDFGFSNEVSVYVDGKLVYSGNDGMRTRDFFFLGTVGFFDSLYLTIKPGSYVNVVFVVSLSKATNGAYGGLAVAAKFPDMSNIKLSEFPHPENFQ